MTDPPVAAQAYVKVFTSRCEIPIRGFIDVFHAWVKDKRTDDLLIDVHDYTHVHDGPGVIVVAHEAHYGMDRRGGELGLVYRARRTPPSPVGDAIKKAAQAAWAACRSLEQDTAGKVAFATDRHLVGFEDRLNAPNTPEIFSKLQPELAAFASLLGKDAAVTHVGEPRDVFAAEIRSEARSLDVLAAL